MRIKKPHVRGDGGIQCSYTVVKWSRNPIKSWLYKHVVNDLNKYLFEKYQLEIEL